MSAFRQFLRRRNLAAETEPTNHHLEHDLHQAACSTNYFTSPETYAADNLRLVVFKESDKAGRRCLYDSNVVRRRTDNTDQNTDADNTNNKSKSHSKYSRRTNSSRNVQPKDEDTERTPSTESATIRILDDQFELHESRENTDSLGEMMFGAISMRYKGESIKMHHFKEQLMLAKVFTTTSTTQPAPFVQPPVINEDSVMGATGGDCGSSDSDSQYSTIRSVDGWLPRSATPNRSIPVQVPEHLIVVRVPTTPPIRSRTNTHHLLATGSYQHSTTHHPELNAPTNSMSRSSSAGGLSAQGGANNRASSPVCGSIPIGLAKLTRLRLSQASALEWTGGTQGYNRRRLSASSGSDEMDRGTEFHSARTLHNNRGNSLNRQVQLGVGVLFKCDPSTDKSSDLSYRHFLLTHIHQMELEIQRLQSAVGLAYQLKTHFYKRVYQAWHQFQCNICLLHNAPRLSHPIWLDLVASPVNYPVFSNGLPTDLAQQFLGTFKQLVVAVDNKQTNFFFSRVLSSLLTYHLTWVSSVAPPDNAGNSTTPPPTRKCSQSIETCAAPMLTSYSSQNSYADSNLSDVSVTNPIGQETPSNSYNVQLAQYLDMCGNVGYPVRHARTILVGSGVVLLRQLLLVLSYWLRCSALCDRTDRLVAMDELRLFCEQRAQTGTEAVRGGESEAPEAGDHVSRRVDIEPYERCLQQACTSSRSCSTECATSFCSQSTFTGQQVLVNCNYQTECTNTGDNTVTVTKQSTGNSFHKQTGCMKRTRATKSDSGLISRLRAGSCSSALVELNGRRRDKLQLQRATERSKLHGNCRSELRESYSETMTVDAELATVLTGRFSVRAVTSAASESDLLQSTPFSVAVDFTAGNCAELSPSPTADCPTFPKTENCTRLRMSQTQSKLAADYDAPDHATPSTYRPHADCQDNKPIVALFPMDESPAKRRQQPPCTPTISISGGVIHDNKPISEHVESPPCPSSWQARKRKQSTDSGYTTLTNANTSERLPEALHIDNEAIDGGVVLSEGATGTGDGDKAAISDQHMMATVLVTVSPPAASVLACDAKATRPDSYQEPSTALSGSVSPDCRHSQHPPALSSVDSGIEESDVLGRGKDRDTGKDTRKRSKESVCSEKSVTQAHSHGRLFADSHEQSIHCTTESVTSATGWDSRELSPVHSPLAGLITNDYTADSNQPSTSQLSAQSNNDTKSNYCLRNLGHSLFGGVLDEFSEHFALSAVQGVSGEEMLTILTNHSQGHANYSGYSNPLLASGVTTSNDDGTVYILADTDTWEVKILAAGGSQQNNNKETSATFNCGAVPLAHWSECSQPSQAVLNMVDNACMMTGMNANSEFCLSYMEDCLSDVYSKSCALSDLVLQKAHEHDQLSMNIINATTPTTHSSYQQSTSRASKSSTKLCTENISDIIDCALSDMPLLLAVAGVHSPQVLSSIDW